MKTRSEPIACAVIRQPSINRNGTVNMISRSLKVPGSDSSALTTRYVGLPVSFARKLALRPVGQNAPPRPRRPESRISWTTAAGSSCRARSSGAKPPASRYAASVSSGCSSPPCRTTNCSDATVGLSSQFRDDRRHVGRRQPLAIAVVDRHDGAPAAPAGALDRPQRHLTVLRRLAGVDPEVVLERLEHLLRAHERARDVGADLDEMPADGLQVVHVVERRDRHAVGGRLLERLRDLTEGRGREPSVALLREPQRRQGRRARDGVAGADRLDLVVERLLGRAHLSTSPITASREPTIAIRSAT